MKKINNYDNTVRNTSRAIFKTFNIKGQYHREDKSLSNFNSSQSATFAVPTNDIVNIGSSGGNGNRSFLYASYKKQARNKSEKNSLLTSANKLEFKKA
jgi:hypothetical protein